MGFTPAQQEAIKVTGRPLFIQAGAGTGKTFTLTNRLAYGLSEKSGRVIPGVDRLLTITFTEKAAGELLGRVRARLREVGLMQEALEVDAAWISTIHSMCRRILTAHAFEAGIDPGRELLSDEQSGSLLAGALDEVFTEHSGEDAFELLLAGYGNSAEKVTTLLKELVQLLELAPEGVASFELGPEIEGPDATMFASLVSLLERTNVELGELGLPEGKSTYAKAADAIAHDAELLRARLIEQHCSTWHDVAAVFDEAAIPPKNKVKEPYATLFSDVIGVLHETMDEVYASEAYERLRCALSFAEEACKRHVSAKRGLGVLDVGDLLTETYRLLSKHPEIARAYQEQFASVMVDEFQDTDSLQVAIVKCLCDEGLSTLATVGDAQQSIYGFRGADLEVYRQMRKEMDLHDSQEVELTENFRSHPDILGFVEDIFSTPEFFGGEFLKVSSGRDPEPPAWIEKDDCRVRVIFSAGSRSKENARRCTPVDALRAADARALADQFEALHEKGAAYGDMALLLRSTKGSKSGAYVRELRSRGIPCVISGGSDFYSHPEVSACVAFLRFLADCDDDEALFELMGSHFLDIGDDELLVLANASKRYQNVRPDDVRAKNSLFDALRHVAAASQNEKDEKTPEMPSLVHAYQVLSRALADVCGHPFSQVLLRAAFESGWTAGLSARGAEGAAVQANIQRVADLLDDYEAERGHVIGGAAQYFSNLLDMAQRGAGARDSLGAMVSDGKEAVQIMTIHASKGLEFPIVAVAEYDDSNIGKGSDVISLSEEGKSYLALSVDAQEKIKKDFDADAEEPDTFGAASSRAGFSVHAQRLQRRRADEESQRLLYVALTRARDVLILIEHDSSYLTKQKLGSALGCRALSAAFDEELPQSGAKVRTASGALVSMTLNEVPFESVGETPEEGGTEKDARIEHPLVPLAERPHISSYLSIPPLSYSYSSLARGVREVSAAAPPREALVLPERVIPEKTVSPFGSAFHLVAQWLACTGSDEGIEARIGAAERRYVLDALERERLVDALDSWRSSKRYAEARSYPEVYAEHHFCVDLMGLPLEGYLDLFCLDRDHRQALVIDYKTGESGEESELKERYRLQADCYAYAVLSAAEVTEVELCFVRPEVDMQEIRFTYDQSDLETLPLRILDACSTDA
ncbi:MAG: UvrD-helicase domain-containing protein [Coriobacteriales bacterium]|jgi:ATP-dependent helicase/nuclease subunit A